MASLSLSSNLHVSALLSNGDATKFLSSLPKKSVKPVQSFVVRSAVEDEKLNGITKVPGLSVISTIAATAATLIATSNVNAAMIKELIPTNVPDSSYDASQIYFLSGLPEKMRSDVGGTTEKIGSDIGSTAQKMKSDVEGTTQKIGSDVSSTSQKIGSDVGSTSDIISQGPENVKGAVASAQKGGQDLGSKVQDAIKSPFSGLPNPLEGLGKQGSSGGQGGELFGTSSGFGPAGDKVKSDIDTTSQKVGSDIQNTQKFFSQGSESAQGNVASVQKGAQDLGSKVQETLTSPLSGAVNPLEELGKKENVGQSRTDELTGRAKSTVPQPEDIARNLGSKAEAAKDTVAQAPGLGQQSSGQGKSQGGFFSNLFKGTKGKIESGVESAKSRVGGATDTDISTKPV